MRRRETWLLVIHRPGLPALRVTVVRLRSRRRRARAEALWGRHLADLRHAMAEERAHA